MKVLNLRTYLYNIFINEEYGEHNHACHMADLIMDEISKHDAVTLKDISNDASFDVVTIQTISVKREQKA